MQELDFNKLTRRADRDRAETWHVYCDDIRAGTISRAVGMPNAKNCWNWSAGFYPGSGPGEIRCGNAGTFEEAKAKFKTAWLKFAASRSQDDFEEWREQQEWTARKYAARDVGLRCPKR